MTQIRRDKAAPSLRYLLELSGSSRLPDVSMHIAGLDSTSVKHYGNIQPPDMEPSVMAVLNDMNNGVLDLEDLCSVGYPKLSLSPINGSFNADEAKDLALAIVEDLTYDEDELYEFDVLPKKISFQYHDTANLYYGPENIEQLADQLSYISQVLGWPPKQRHDSIGWYLDVPGCGGTGGTKIYMVVADPLDGKTIPQDVDVIISLDKVENEIKEHPTLKGRDVISTNDFLYRLYRQKIDGCVRGNFNRGKTVGS